MAYFTPYTIVDFFSGSQRCEPLTFSFRGEKTSGLSHQQARERREHLIKGGKAKKNQDLSETKTLSMMLRRNMVYLVITIK